MAAKKKKRVSPNPDGRPYSLDWSPEWMALFDHFGSIAAVAHELGVSTNMLFRVGLHGQVPNPLLVRTIQTICGTKGLKSPL